TFPLPEAQLDRFLIRLSLGYPALDEESKMLQRLQHVHPIEKLGTVVSAQEVLACQEAIRDVYIDDKVRRHLLEIVQSTRERDGAQSESSPRAYMTMFRPSPALAAVSGRNFVLPDDVKKRVVPVLGHRLILRPESRLRKVTVASVVREIVDDVRVPVPAHGDEEEDAFVR